MEKEIDGIVYVTKPETDKCEGCITEVYTELCRNFGDCKNIIWEKKNDNQ